MKIHSVTVFVTTTRKGAIHGLQNLLWSKSGKHFSGLFYKKKLANVFLNVVKTLTMVLSSSCEDVHLN
jgi:hypothetical protein